MKQKCSYRIKLVLVGFVAAIVLGVGSAKADFTFGEPINLGHPVNSGYSERSPSVSPDGLELYFETDRDSDPGTTQLWVAKRPTPEDPWAEPSPLGPEINSEEEHCPHISPDGLELYFTGIRRPGGYGNSDIWVSRRSALNAPWGAAINLGPLINSSDRQYGASITADGLELFFVRREGTTWIDAKFSIWSARRATREGPWGEPERLGELVNSTGHDCASSISADGLFLCFSNHPNWAVRPGGQGGPDIWVTTRPTRDAPWRSPWNPGSPLNTVYFESNPSISADGRWLYFSDFWWNSEQECRPGGYGSDDLWKAPIIPIVDFNGDGLVNSADMCIMVNNWGTDNSKCDIGPMPWGDGVVDVEDLKVLAEHLFEDYRLIAHWMLDEEAGETAHDSVGNYNGTLNGEPLWQPEGGILDGALEFDGNDDYMRTPFVLNPGEESFSAFAWIKGGTPGQVIISQSDTAGARGVFPGCTWLGIKSSNGSLMTGLMETTFGTLETDPIITDSQWHHIGLVYDIVAMRRHLYLDGAEVAADTDFIGGVQTTGGLYIGAGQALDAGTFFSGMIDDVRIYNVALTAKEIAVLVQ